MTPGSIGESAGGVLRNISSHIAVNNDYREVLRRRGSFEVLVNQLKSSNLTTVSNACGALWNLSAKCPEDQQTLWELGAMSNLQALTVSKHQMIATAASAAIRNLQAFKHHSDKLNKTTESNDNLPLSSSFPCSSSRASHHQQGFSNGPSPFAEAKATSSTTSSNRSAAVFNMVGSPIQSGLDKNGSKKESILYSDTPNSNVVHLNFLHMLAAKGGTPQQSPLRHQLKMNPQQPLSNRTINQAHTSSEINRSQSVEREQVSVFRSSEDVENDDDEQPTNFGQRFQESEQEEERTSAKLEQQQKINPPANQGAGQHVTFSANVETVEQTPNFSCRSSIDSLNSVEVPSIRSEVVSEYSRLPSGGVSPTELPESPGAHAAEQQRRRDELQQQRQQHLQQQHQGPFKMPVPATAVSAFAAPLPIQRGKLMNPPEEAFPADGYADEMDKPMIYATEDTPAMLSHATSLSNLTTPGFETPGGHFSPVRAVGDDDPVSPPGTSGMRFFFKKEIEPEPAEDEMVQYYTEDTPCHLSASSSLSSLSVMSHCSSRRSAATTPLRQKVFALQSGVSNPMTPGGSVFTPGTGGTALHPRVMAAASKHQISEIKSSPFFVQNSQFSNSPFVSSPQVQPRQTTVLLEESEDSHNMSNLSTNTTEEMPVEQAHETEKHNSEDDEDDEETDDLIQQLIHTALESPKNETVVEVVEPTPEETIENLVAPVAEPEEIGDERKEDLETEPTENDLQMVEQCINFVLTPGEESKDNNNNNNDDDNDDVDDDHLKEVEPKVDNDVKEETPKEMLKVKQVPIKRKSLINMTRLKSPQKIENDKLSPRRKSNIEHRSVSPGGVSRGGSSSGGASSVKLGAKKNQSSAKRSPSAIPTASKTTVNQQRRPRSRTESENSGLISPHAQPTKVSPSSSSTTSSNAKVTNTKKWNFSTKPSRTAEPTEGQGRSCRHHSLKPDQERPTSSSSNVTKKKPTSSQAVTPVEKSPGENQANHSQTDIDAVDPATMKPALKTDKSNRRVLMTTV